MLPIEERSRKRNAIGSAGPNSLKVVFTLLAEAVAIYMRVSIIEVEESSFERLFARTRLVILF